MITYPDLVSRHSSKFSEAMGFICKFWKNCGYQSHMFNLYQWFGC